VSRHVLTIHVQVLVRYIAILAVIYGKFTAHLVQPILQILARVVAVMNLTTVVAKVASVNFLANLLMFPACRHVRRRGVAVVGRLAALEILCGIGVSITCVS
jgi:hypothetical protein